MIRYINEHTLRCVYSLDGLWQLAPQDGTNQWFTAYVPGVWERIPALTRYRGIANYTRQVHIEETRNILLRFGGVSHTGRVFWDGDLITHHYNAFTAFETLLENVQAGDHSLLIEVDNRFKEDSTLHIPNDYYTYGGVNRSVEMHSIGDLYIVRMAFTSVKTAVGAYQGTVRVTVKAVCDIAAAQVRVTLAGSQANVDVPAMNKGEEKCITTVLDVQGIIPWDVHDAHLYELGATLIADGRPVDDLIDQVGFRVIEISGEKLLINGSQMFIKGFNRHEDHGEFGCSLSVDAMMDDLALLCDMGINSVRTSHYPNDPRFLDLCDMLGILVWEENHARAIPGHLMRNPIFTQQCRDCNEEMVLQHINHPCIYVWGILNECESETEFGHSVYAAQFAQIKELDPSRAVTFASSRTFSDVCMDLVDIASFNIYPSWYIDDKADAYSKKLIAWLEENGASNKPIIFSEFGAGAIAGFHDVLGHAKWSEERQCDILAEQLEALLGNPRVSGLYIWQFADVRVADECAIQRPKTQNNKGIVDMYRRPKMSYATVKAAYMAKKDKI
jgi:beta-glucuronidase